MNMQNNLGESVPVVNETPPHIRHRRNKSGDDELGYVIFELTAQMMTFVMMPFGKMSSGLACRCAMPCW